MISVGRGNRIYIKEREFVNDVPNHLSNRLSVEVKFGASTGQVESIIAWLEVKGVRLFSFVKA